MKILNLYAGLGGNRKHWGGANVTITAVELENDIADVYKKLYPEDNVVVGDAHEYLLKHFEEFDFIWTSPPCQTHSKMMKATRHKRKRYSDMALYQEILLLQHFFKGLFVVENVKGYYDPLIRPSKELGRHFIWSNFPISNFEHKNIKNFTGTGTEAGVKKMKDWLGIHFDGHIYYKDNHCPAQVLRNCVHPDMGLHIFNCALDKLQIRKEIGKQKQQTLF